MKIILKPNSNVNVRHTYTKRPLTKSQNLVLNFLLNIVLLNVM